ncbi:SDR family NAD(P)-dependent oxidoreductase [Dictyobacter kobayashii]|uniref:Short-chain dehydrogenase n=1 Tax=Dictyobacter kobayashii TaxID=2014872 RepID=A0A402ATS6_9CHLR|nr:SDR family NAD(P)-dependent oxidoreductase [Dictyobacter kobayashii]GCE22520.1 short-chain dehydrogenase [Dictyobacter kobayashii]
MDDKKQISSPVVLVTGSSHGIGLEVCRQLARAGMTVLLTARDFSKASIAAQQLVEEGRDVRPYALDVTQDDSIRALATILEQEFGRLDVLVNNAAAYVDWTEKATTADLQAAHAILETNVFGAWRTTQILLPLIRKSQHGRIVNVSSGAGSHGDQQFGLTINGGSVASYGISKAALNALTSKLAAELEGTSILVNAVCPGLTATAPGMEAMGAGPVEKGASSIVWAVNLPDNGPTGGFFRYGEPLPW